MFPLSNHWKTAVAALAAMVAVLAAARSYWVVAIGPYDWPESVPVEENRVSSPGGFSVIVPEGWRSAAGLTYISASSGSSEFFSTQIWIEKGIRPFSQPDPLPVNARFQGIDAYEQKGVTRNTERSRPFFESKIFIRRHGEVFQIRVRTWRRPLPDAIPESLRRYIETFEYAPSRAGS
jgi:hypothetical protein